ncbi:MAG: hypothetical protein Q9160_001673 [Pyrenula sp. 1 TL-2023]
MLKPTIARDLTIEASYLSRSKRPNPTRNTPASQLKKLLDSRNDREILEGLRKVITSMYQGQPCLTYFSAVVKNVANTNIEIKKLVYLYLLNYAESEPDLALLSINAIQKSLTDQSPQVRALALRTMSGIRVPVISQIVSLAIKRGCGDMSPLVRKAAASSIPKCYRLDPTTLPQLLDYLSTLLGDKQYYVVGPAVMAFLEICPERIDLIHKYYRSLVKKLVDMDEWGQLATIRLLTYYSRKCFPRRKERRKTTTKKAFYEDEVDEEEQSTEEVPVLDSDLELFLKACTPLLQSRNSAVIVSVVRCFVALGTPDYLTLAVGPLMLLLQGPPDVVHVAMYNVVSLALIIPEAFAVYAAHFLIRSSDPLSVWRLKLEVLTLLFPYAKLHAKNVILNELEHFCHSADLNLVRESVRAIGRCAQGDQDSSRRCFQLLLKQVSSSDENLVSESLTVIRHLIQQNPSVHQHTVIRLAQNLDKIPSPSARATVIWLVGEYSTSSGDIAPDVLRILSKNFSNESEAAKQQILLLAAKVYLHHLQNEGKPHSPSPSPPDDENASNDDPTDPSPTPSPPAPPSPIPPLYRYILLLTRYDPSYDLRDRARLFKSLLSTPSSTQLASLLLQAPKPVPNQPSPSESRRGIQLGTATLVLGPEVAGGAKAGLPGYEELEVPRWVEEGAEPDARLRDELERGAGGGGGVASSSGAYEERKAGVVGGVSAAERLEEAAREQGVVEKVKGAGAGAKGKTLEDWLGEEEGEESSESETEEEEETDEEEEEMETETETESEEESSGDED